MRDLRLLGAQDSWHPKPRFSVFIALLSIPLVIAAACLFTVCVASIVSEALAADSPSILLVLNLAESREQNPNAVLPLGHFFVRSLLTTGLRPLPGVSRLAYRPQS